MERHEDVSQELFIMNQTTVEKLFELGTDVFTLYAFYYKTSKWQKTTCVWANNEYVMKKLGWGRPRLLKTKAQLEKAQMIEQVRIVDEKTNQVQKWAIKLKYLQTFSTSQVGTESTSQFFPPVDGCDCNNIYNNKISKNSYNNIEKSNINVAYKENQEMASSMPVPPEVAPTNNSKTANDYFDKFMDWWNTVLIAREENEEKNITKILVGSNARKAMFRSRWVDTRQFMTGIKGIKNPAPDQIFEFMTKGVIGYNYINSEFLQGKIKGNFHSHGYKFEFDSVFRPSMWTKLLENKFFNSDLKRPTD